MHPTQGCQPKNLRATIPTTVRPPYSSNLALAGKPSLSHPFVLVFYSFVTRAFGYVDALEAVMVMAQKEPSLMDAAPTSHRVRLWRGGSSSTATYPDACGLIS